MGVGTTAALPCSGRTATSSGIGKQSDKRRFPTDAVYYPTLTLALRLVTCGGEFDATAQHYRSNVIVFATLNVALRRLRAPAGRSGPRPAGRPPGRGRTGPTRWPRPAGRRPALEQLADGQPTVAGSVRTRSCSPRAPRSLTALASMALARSTAVLHAAVATGAADAWWARGSGPRTGPPRRCRRGPGGHRTRRRADEHAADQRHDDQQPGDQQPGQRGPPSPSRPGSRDPAAPAGTELSGRLPVTVGPDHVTSQSLELLIRASSCSEGHAPSSWIRRTEPGIVPNTIEVSRLGPNGGAPLTIQGLRDDGNRARGAAGRVAFTCRDLAGPSARSCRRAPAPPPWPSAQTGRGPWP